MTVVVQVWGEGALFTRPEHKAERLTYPVMPPTAAVGVLEAIFWKPEFDWIVHRIEVLKPISYRVLRRNETSTVLSAAQALAGTRVVTAESRMQRNAVCLSDVTYRIHAAARLRKHATRNVLAYESQFERRLKRGACFHQPYLGSREFSASFGLPDDTPPNTDNDILPLGVMLHSIDHPQGAPPVSRWFHAVLDHGVLDVPAHGLTPAEFLG